MKFKHNKKIIFVIATVLLLTVAVGTTLAYIVTSTDPVKNIFTSSKVATAVIENGSNGDEGSKVVENVGTKSDVQIKNTGDTEAYIRAAVIVTWKSKSGTVWAQTPSSTEYSIDWAFDDETNPTAWIKGSDDYYYYTSPVAPGVSTGSLINSATQEVDGPVGSDGTQYYLSIEIVASGIQSTPISTVVDQWGVTVDDDGTIISK